MTLDGYLYPRCTTPERDSRNSRGTVAHAHQLEKGGCAAEKAAHPQRERLCKGGQRSQAPRCGGENRDNSAIHKTFAAPIEHTITEKVMANGQRLVRLLRRAAQDGRAPKTRCLPPKGAQTGPSCCEPSMACHQTSLDRNPPIRRWWRPPRRGVCVERGGPEKGWTDREEGVWSVGDADTPTMDAEKAAICLRFHGSGRGCGQSHQRRGCQAPTRRRWVALKLRRDNVCEGNVALPVGTNVGMPKCSSRCV